MVVGGILPFGAVFIELYFIMSSVWLQRFYYVFGFLALVLLILLITCAEMAIVLCYFQLCNENYLWQWRAFFNTGSAGQRNVCTRPCPHQYRINTASRTSHPPAAPFISQFFAVVLISTLVLFDTLALYHPSVSHPPLALVAIVSQESSFSDIRLSISHRPSRSWELSRQCSTFATCSSRRCFSRWRQERLGSSRRGGLCSKSTVLSRSIDLHATANDERTEPITVLRVPGRGKQVR